MRNKSLDKVTVIEELEKMEKKLNEGNDLVWINFPYSNSNLAIWYGLTFLTVIPTWLS